LVNAERYITPELKEYEEKILNAEERMIAIEQRYFMALVQDASEYVTQVQQNARVLATIDCLLSFARVAKSNNYCKPKIADTESLEIKDGRHPVVEKQLPVGEPYVPNDIYLGQRKPTDHDHNRA
jgi:DNA mismatch repair protein MutS